jgi:endogenous inhibitor of DNA gyrase (YacG/DUF329 family)
LAESESLCVYCRRQRIDPKWAPFCSERCRMADLGRWLSEDYRLPGEDSERPDNDDERDDDH